jgi:outer membrane protein assembly factor BamB
VAGQSCQPWIAAAGGSAETFDPSRQRKKRTDMARNARSYGIESLFILLVASSCLVRAADWPRFRGPNGTGVSPERGLPVDFDRSKAAWFAGIPKGNSSPMVFGGRVFLTAYEGGERIALCYDAATGQLRWRQSVRAAHRQSFHAMNGPVTPTPATDGQRVFVFLPEVGLLAYSRDGRELWRRPLGPFRSVQGLASSPIVVDDRVVLLIDTPEDAHVAAFDVTGGKPLWKTNRPVGVLGGYTTPTVVSRPGRSSELVVAGAVELTGYDAATGERLWWAPGMSSYPAAPPFVAGGSVYTLEPVGAGWPAWAEPVRLFDRNNDGVLAIEEAAGDASWKGSLHGIDHNAGNRDGVITRAEYEKAVSDGAEHGGLVRTRVGGRGDVRNTHVMWRYGKGLPFLTGALLYEEILYVVRNGSVSTFNASSGQLIGQQRLRDALGEYYASPVAGDGKIYLASLDGKMSVLRAGADWEVLSTSDLGEHIVATPAIAGGRVFVRTETTLYAFGGTRAPD